MPDCPDCRGTGEVLVCWSDILPLKGGGHIKLDASIPIRSRCDSPDCDAVKKE